MSENEGMVLCGANAYTKKYFLNDQFSALPEHVQNELQIMCVLYTEEVGGILTLQYDEDGSLFFRHEADELDYYYDEVGAGLKIRQLQQTKQELMEMLELYYKVFYLGEDQ